jgi:hypothetical protein
MGFKADISFLQKLTMGATATRAAIAHLKEVGFAAIELERYSTSNKIWSTKVKRLRLADLLCARTGLRVEVRAKSDLQIKMSDSPTNPDRRWDSGLRDDDLVGLVACDGGSMAVRVRGAPVFFAVRDLRSTSHLAKLGPPKSASEGAERDLTWPSIVPSNDGEVVEVAADRLRVRMRSGRNQSYQLKGKTPYVRVGDQFVGEASILAGVVPRMVSPASLLKRTWSPAKDLRSASATDRYVAAKALASGEATTPANVLDLLHDALAKETEPRTALEIAGALARLKADKGFEYLAAATKRPASEEFPAYLRMEAVLILSELTPNHAASVLDAVAGDPSLKGEELRQAAVWGLGRFGVGSYAHLIKYLADEEDDVALHAIAALGKEAPLAVVEKLAQMLVESPDARTQAAASEALRMIGSSDVARVLVGLAGSKPAPWVVASLGRLPREVLAGAKLPGPLATAIAPVSLVSAPNNWLLDRAVATDFQFLLQQDL